MDNEVNISHITLLGFVEMNKYRFLYFSIMFTVYILIICSNSVIVYLIWSNKSLHEPMYIFIAALLFNSILYSTAVYPKLLIDFLSEKQIITYSACLFQFFIFYSVGGTEFLLLAVMAFDRYVSICKPFRYPTIMTKNTVKTFAILAWLLPPCQIAIETYFLAKSKLCSLNLNGMICNNAIFKLECVRSKPLTVIGVVALLDVAILPMLFTVFTYTNIFRISYQKCKTFRKKAAETCIPHLLILINFSYLAAYDVIIARVESDLPETARFLMTLQVLLYHPLFNPFIYGLKMKEISKYLNILFKKSKSKCFGFL